MYYIVIVFLRDSIVYIFSHLTEAEATERMKQATESGYTVQRYKEGPFGTYIGKGAE